MQKSKSHWHLVPLILLPLTLPAFADDKASSVPDNCYQSLDKPYQLLARDQVTLNVISTLPADALANKHDIQRSDKKYSPDHARWYVQVTDTHSHTHGPDSDVIYVGSDNQSAKIEVISLKDTASPASIGWKDNSLLRLSVFIGTKMSTEMVFDTRRGKWASQKARAYYGEGCE